MTPQALKSQWLIDSIGDRCLNICKSSVPMLVAQARRLTRTVLGTGETAKTEDPCYSRCGTIKTPPVQIS